MIGRNTRTCAGAVMSIQIRTERGDSRCAPSGYLSRMARSAALPEPVKPRLRGVIHQYAFFVALVLGVALVVLAPDGRARIAAAIYALSVTGLLGTSALKHRRGWTIRAWMWMSRLDRSMHFV